MALNGLFCADVPLRNYSLTHYIIGRGLMTFWRKNYAFSRA